MRKTLLKAALVGTGFMAPAHLEALRRLGNVAVIGVLGSSAAKSKRAADAWGLETAYHDFESVLEDTRLDSVHILTPNRYHFDMASRALTAGKHVLCEKPLAMTAVESEGLVKLASETGLAAGVNYNVRYYPLCGEARARVLRGDLGRITSITGSYTQDWLLYEDDYNWRVLAEHGGPSRVVADIGTHWLDLIGHITGLSVQAVFADLATVHAVRHRPMDEAETYSGSKGDREVQSVAIDTEDTGAILLRYAGGAQGMLFVSQVAPGRKNYARFEISGSKAALAWNSESPEELWIGYRGLPNQVLVKDPSLMSSEARPLAGYPGGHAEGYPDTFKQCLRAFYDAIEGGCQGEAQYPTFAQAHQEMLLVDAIIVSHRSQSWTNI